MRALAKFSYKGKNAQLILAKLARANICVYNVLQSSTGFDFCCHLTCKHKVFAIFEGSWYNITYVSTVGAFSHFTNLGKRVGVIVGLFVFFAMVFVSQLFVFDVKVQGAMGYGHYVQDVLKQNGVKRFALFSNIDIKDVQNKVVSCNGISFASLKKVGSTVVVEVKLSQADTTINPKNYAGLYTDVSGVVQDIVVWRGTALVQTGDSVKAGQLIVGAYFIYGQEQKQPTFVLASVKIKASATVDFYTDSIEDVAKSAALAYAKFVLGYNLEDHLITPHQVDGKNLLRVDCSYIKSFEIK